MKTRTISPATAARHGFSLVEVALAIGIVSFALLSCVGLNMVSLSSFADARTVDVSSRIFRSVLNEAQISNFSDIDSKESSFDSEGFPIENADNPNVLYTAKTTVGAPSIQGTQIDADTTAKILTVNVYAHGKQMPNTLVSTRTAVIGNRMKAQ